MFSFSLSRVVRVVVLVCVCVVVVVVVVVDWWFCSVGGFGGSSRSRQEHSGDAAW